MADYFKKGQKIRYKISERKDKHVVLLHGYLETLEVWDGFAALLAGDFTVLTLDLPGHGESSLIEDNTMERMADAVDGLLEHLGLDRVYMVGHSMGGYVATRFALKYPLKTAGLVLFHSNTFADSPEKRTNRLNDIVLIREGKLADICKAAIPGTFARENVARFQPEIKKITADAGKHSPDGIMSCINAMTIRIDTTIQLKNINQSILSIAGVRDPFLTEETARNLAIELKAEFYLLDQSGHMGFIEEPVTSAVKLRNWILAGK